MSDRFVDFLEEGIDLAIRIGEVRDPNLIVHQIGITRRVTVGAVDYFRDREVPKTPADLVNHNCIVYSNLTTGNNWHFKLSSGGTTQVLVKGNLQVDSSNAIREAVLSGLGIVVCPVWLLGELKFASNPQGLPAYILTNLCGISPGEIYPCQGALFYRIFHKSIQA